MSLECFLYLDFPLPSFCLFLYAGCQHSILSSEKINLASLIVNDLMKTTRQLIAIYEIQINSRIFN